MSVRRIAIFSWMCVGLAGLAGMTAGCNSTSSARRGAEDEIPAAGDYELVAATNKPEYQLGEPVDLTVSLRNVGTMAVEVADAAHSSTYQIEVRLAQRIVLESGEIIEVAPATLYGRTSGWMQRRAGSSHVLRLQPGKDVVVTIPRLNRLYDMSLDGDYTIRVKRQLPLRLKGGREAEIISKEIKVSIK